MPEVRWLYFLLGVGGAFLFYSGNLLWIESRRKRRQVQQGRAQIGMAKATVGVCIGVCVAISLAFVAATWLESFAPASNVDAGIQWVCFTSWLACAVWALVRPVAKAARELLWAASLATLLVPIAHGAATGWWWWTSAAQGQWILFGIDATAVALAFGFALLARASRKRALHGEPNSVWAEPGNGTSLLTDAR